MAIPDQVQVASGAHAQRFVPASFVANSISVLNPNNGVVFVARNRDCISTQTGAWDWKVPSQSYAYLPGPFQSVGLYYQDQSGSARPGDISTYASIQKFDLPVFQAIGLTLASVVTTLDIGQGNQPVPPATNNIRLWSDGAGNLHILNSNGTDQVVITNATIGSTALGGDLYGTISNGHIAIRNGSAALFYDSGGTTHNLIANTAANIIYYYLGTATGGAYLVDQTGIARYSFDTAGNFVATGNATIQGGQIVVQQAGSANNGYIYLGDVLIERWTTQQLRIVGSGGLTVQGPILVESDQTLTFAVNGYGWKGVSGQPVVLTNASVVATAGAIYLDGNISTSVRFYWDGTYLCSGTNFRSQQNISSVGGIYYAGATNQSSISIWNPGEFYITSSPGNLYATGQLIAVGGPVTGKGAYVNSASSITVKSNVQELTPAECLADVLNATMRPIRFTYQEPLYFAPHLGSTPETSIDTVSWTAERLGFISEEVNQVVPEAVGMVGDVAVGLMTDAMIPILWGAVRNLDARLKQLEPPTI